MAKTMSVPLAIILGTGVPALHWGAILFRYIQDLSTPPPECLSSILTPPLHVHTAACIRPISRTQAVNMMAPVCAIGSVGGSVYPFQCCLFVTSRVTSHDMGDGTKLNPFQPFISAEPNRTSADNICIVERHWYTFRIVLVRGLDNLIHKRDKPSWPQARHRLTCVKPFWRPSWTTVLKVPSNRACCAGRGECKLHC